jgi:hypothetical protein
MSRYVMLLAMLLVQAQPLVGAALCHGHHDQPTSACSTGGGHHQSGTPQSGDHDDHGDQGSDDQCAATHACAAAAAVIRADGPDRGAFTGYRLAVATAEADRALLGLRSPPFHPPKA